MLGCGPERKGFLARVGFFPSPRTAPSQGAAGRAGTWTLQCLGPSAGVPPHDSAHGSHPRRHHHRARRRDRQRRRHVAPGRGRRRRRHPPRRRPVAAGGLPRAGRLRVRRRQAHPRLRPAGEMGDSHRWPDLGGRHERRGPAPRQLLPPLPRGRRRARRGLDRVPRDQHRRLPLPGHRGRAGSRSRPSAPRSAACSSCGSCASTRRCTSATSASSSSPLPAANAQLARRLTRRCSRKSTST